MTDASEHSPTRTATPPLSSRVPRIVVQASSDRLPDIQILRAVAILLVLFQHLSISPPLLRMISPTITVPGYVGVELFFVISGYVVTLSFSRGGFAPVSFLVRRIFRLHPAILVFLALGFAATFIFNVVLNMSHTGLPGIRTLFVTPWDRFSLEAVAIFGGFFINLPPPPRT